MLRRIILAAAMALAVAPALAQSAVSEVTGAPIGTISVLLDSQGRITAKALTSALNSISAKVDSKVDAAALFAANTTWTGSMALSAAAQSLPLSPTGNPTTGPLLTTYATLNVQGTTIKSGNREYLVHIGLTSNTGAGQTNGNQDKAALYAGVVGQSGTGDIWAFNPLVTMQAGSGSYDAQGIELDFNNNNADRGGADGGAGLAAPVAYGMTITGAGAYQSTAALGVFGKGTPIWHRGIVVGSNSVSDATFQDLGSATISLDIRGTHTYGLDLAKGGFSGGAIRLSTNGAIVARNVGDTADLQALTVDNGPALVVGTGMTALRLRNNQPLAAWNVDGSATVALASLNNGNNAIYGQGAGMAMMATIFAPTSDNAYPNGTSANRWSAVYSAGLVQTGATTVSALPTCNAAAKGARHFVSDANATTFATTAAGGGSNNVPVVCNGSNWIIG